MAYRDRTGLFLSYRQSYVHHPTSRLPEGVQRDDDRQGLLSGQSQGDTVIEMDALPPRWADISDEIDEILVNIRTKSSQLEKLHQKHVLPGFEDRTQEEIKIESLTSDITQQFHKSNKLIKKVEKQSEGGRAVEKRIGNNAKAALASKVQIESTKFRKAQSTYMKKLKDRAHGVVSMRPNGHAVFDSELDIGTSSNASAVSVQQTKQYTRGVIEQREKEIDEIAKGITELADIFTELQEMVIDQGTALDRIGYNIENTHVSVKEANKELVKASGTQNKTRKRNIILLLIILIIAVIIALIYRPVARKSDHGDVELPPTLDLTPD